MADGAEKVGSEEETSADVTIISPVGDLILDVHDKTRQQSFGYRVSIPQLQHASPYFIHLLDPQKFGEGAKVAARLEYLRKSYDDLAKAPSEELPRVNLQDIGRISRVNTIKNLFSDFLRALHGLELSTAQPPIANLANLAVVADRFGALASFTRYAARKSFMQIIDAKAKGKSTMLTEERIRQKLLIGLLLDYPAWVAVYSKRLIAAGSIRWKMDAVEEPEVALWWDLPRGIEDEMISRRDYVLETIQSIQSQFLKLHAGGERQCRLGYDSSPQCDSFQLGEMVRFFSKIDTLRLEGTLCGSDVSEPYYGSTQRLLELLRQCPAYQIDKNHSHCGLRTKLLPLLTQIEAFLVGNTLEIGICSSCWAMHRAEYAWNKARRPVSWRAPIVNGTSPKSNVPAGSEECLRYHVKVRDMFTASIRDWRNGDVTAGLRFGGPSTPSLKYD